MGDSDVSNVAYLAEQISKLEPPDREQLRVLLDSAASTQLPSDGITRLTTPVIVSTPGVCGGAARIVRTRIPVWTLERLRQLGVSEAEILRSYPSLKAVDLVQAWAYADGNRDEIERQIRENEVE